MGQLSNFWNAEKERCGFILKSGEVVEVENIAESPEEEFEVSESDFEKYYSDTVASWHTHTNDFSNLSLSDYYTFLSLPEWDHWVVSQHKSVKFSVKSECVILEEVVPHDND
ncbi:hypothetical protein KUL118_01770 [Tenacibaculum sp. KUL118]|nr:hypothetical protein KUL113_03570 [Tenacibaculum sp. KUL113]GFD77315.1 hypothetical protein KUL118_01770 [Tenacibaculum sp. KUL118]